MAKAKKAGALVDPLALLAGRSGGQFSFSYDAVSDVLAVRYAGWGTPTKLVNAGNGVTLEFNEHGAPCGVTTAQASKHWPREHLDLLRGPQLTIAAAAKKVKRSPKTLRAQIRNGRIQAQKVGRDWLVWEADLMRYMASLGPTGGRPAGVRAQSVPRRKRRRAA